MPSASHVVFTGAGIRRALQASGATVLYLLGHSEASAGLVVGGDPSLDGRTLAAWLPRRSGRVPRVILFNTCDAVASGLVSASREAGVEAVVAASGAVPIGRMCAYGEMLFRTWLETESSLTDAMQVANAAFGRYGMHLELH
jgi:hypothetical protein